MRPIPAIAARRLSTFLLTLTLTVVAVVLAAEQTKPLYQRLGGYDAVAAVTDDFIGRLATDRQISRFFLGASDDSKRRIRQHVIDLLCQTAGGPCAYTGRDMKTAHKGLGITAADWDTSVRLLVATLDKFKVPAAEREELLAAVSGLRKDIVEK